MKKYSLIILISISIIFSSCFEETKAFSKYPAEYEIRSRFLKKPIKMINFAKNSANLWMKTYDSENGGYFTIVKENGDVHTSNYKTTLSQTRILYAFSRAYMLTGNREYLKYAGYASDFLKNKCWDRENGGFHTILSVEGENIDFEYDFLKELNNYQEDKWSFIQHYALLGLTAYVEATGNQEDYDFLIKARTILDEKLYDYRDGYEGYYEVADYDWRNPRGKGFTPTVDCITTHGLSLYLLTNNDAYRQRLISLGDNVITHMIPTMHFREIGFSEHYDTDWYDRDESFIFIGHMLKTAWCLGRIYLIEPNPVFIEAAEKLLHNINETAWDMLHGGPYTYALGIQGDIINEVKSYWTLEQAITSGLVNYYITGNPLYLKMADESMQFFTNYIIDWDYGDVFNEVKANGEMLDNEEEDLYKGNYYKSAYHSLETAYYVYLYGNLFIYHKEVRLYYYFNQSDRDRSIKMTPIAIEDDKLFISKVTLNGEEYSDFDAENRYLNIPAGLEGEFRINYGIKKP